MAQEYTIDKVSSKVDEWNGNFGPMKTYYVKFVGGEKTVQVNKKPESPTPQSGEVLYGRLETNQHGTKFKGEKRPDGGYKPKTQFKPDPEKQAQIKAQWAIGQAVQLVGQPTKVNKEVSISPFPAIENAAKQFFAMVDRVKDGSTAGQTSTGNQTTGQTSAGNYRTEGDYDGTIDKEPVQAFDESEPINLDDIPF